MKTERGFKIIAFLDNNDEKCSIQKSSAADENKIWLGIDDPNPQIMASQTPEGGTGWVKYAIPENVLLTTRMHLNREEVSILIIALQHFVDTGEVIDG